MSKLYLYDLHPTERAIVQHLKQEEWAKRVTLAKAVNLSADQCSKILTALKDKGWIRRPNLQEMDYLDVAGQWTLTSQAMSALAQKKDTQEPEVAPVEEHQEPGIVVDAETPEPETVPVITDHSAPELAPEPQDKAEAYPYHIKAMATREALAFVGVDPDYNIEEIEAALAIANDDPDPEDKAFADVIARLKAPALPAIPQATVERYFQLIDAMPSAVRQALNPITTAVLVLAV